MKRDSLLRLSNQGGTARKPFVPAPSTDCREKGLFYLLFCLVIKQVRCCVGLKVKLVTGLSLAKAAEKMSDAAEDP
jgi:hypothetical protein